MVKNILVIESNAKTSKEAITEAFQELYMRGYVKETFLKNCLEREREYPTGLMTEIPVAVPHTDTKYVNESAICIVRLKNPVVFRNMEDPSSTINAEFVFNLALKTGEDHIKTLRTVVNIVQDNKFLREAKVASLETVKLKILERWDSF